MADDNYDTTQLALVLESWMIDKLRAMVCDKRFAVERKMLGTHGPDDVVMLHEMNAIVSALSSPEYVD